MIQRIPDKNKYYEPLQINPKKHAKVFDLTPNNPEATLVECVETIKICPTQRITTQADCR